MHLVLLYGKMSKLQQTNKHMMGVRQFWLWIWSYCSVRNDYCQHFPIGSVAVFIFWQKIFTGSPFPPNSFLGCLLVTQCQKIDEEKRKTLDCSLQEVQHNNNNNNNNNNFISFLVFSFREGWHHRKLWQSLKLFGHDAPLKWVLQHHQHIGISKFFTKKIWGMGAKNQSHLSPSLRVTSQHGCHFPLSSL